VLDGIDPFLARTSYSYDPTGRQIAVCNALNFRTSYGYDAAGRRVLLTDAGRPR